MRFYHSCLVQDNYEYYYANTVFDTAGMLMEVLRYLNTRFRLSIETGTMMKSLSVPVLAMMLAESQGNFVRLQKFGSVVYVSRCMNDGSCDTTEANSVYDLVKHIDFDSERLSHDHLIAHESRFIQVLHQLDYELLY